MSDWQPIATAPEDAEVLVWDEGAFMIAIRSPLDAAWIDVGNGRTIEPPPTHWMPLPAPPNT